MVTKGYGFTIDDIDWSCPAELKPYEKAYNLYLEEQDTLSWELGIYFNSAIKSALDSAFNGRNAKTEYVKEPIFSHIGEERKELSEEEKDRQVDLFFKQQNAMRINWKRSHRKNED